MNIFRKKKKLDLDEIRAELRAEILAEMKSEKVKQLPLGVYRDEKGRMASISKQDEFTCQICEKRFGSRNILRGHILGKHTPKEKKVIGHPLKKQSKPGQFKPGQSGNPAGRPKIKRDENLFVPTETVNPTQQTNEGIFFNKISRCWENISAKDLNDWSFGFPILDIDFELRRAGDWLIRNNATKKNYKMFLVGWFKRGTVYCIRQTIKGGNYGNKRIGVD